MTNLTRSDYWQLTVSHWPRAAEIGLTPVIAPARFADPWLPQWYVPTEIEFENPPSREDFLYVVSRTPWMQVWSKDLLPLIERNDWPMSDYAHKAASAELIDEQGRRAGELRVYRHHLWGNERQDVPLVTCDVKNRVTARIRTRDEASRVLNRAENRIQERMVKADCRTEDRMEYEMRLVLHEAGFLKTKPKLPENEDVQAYT